MKLRQEKARMRTAPGDVPARSIGRACSKRESRTSAHSEAELCVSHKRRNNGTNFINTFLGTTAARRTKALRRGTTENRASGEREGVSKGSETYQRCGCVTQNTILNTHVRRGPCFSRTARKSGCVHSSHQRRNGDTAMARTRGNSGKLNRR